MASERVGGRVKGVEKWAQDGELPPWHQMFAEGRQRELEGSCASVGCGARPSA